jgi:hypothetical protein
VENTLKSYPRLKRIEKTLAREMDDSSYYCGGVSYAERAGKVSSKYINGNNRIEKHVESQEEVLTKLASVKKVLKIIDEIVEELKEEKNGEEMLEIIKLRYFQCKPWDQVQRKIHEIERATIMRRRKEALHLLCEKGLQNLAVENVLSN